MKPSVKEKILTPKEQIVARIANKLSIELLQVESYETNEGEYSYERLTSFCKGLSRMDVPTLENLLFELRRNIK